MESSYTGTNIDEMLYDLMHMRLSTLGFNNARNLNQNKKID